MSISFDGVRLARKTGKGPWAALFGMSIVVVEVILTIFLTVAIGAHIFFPSRSFGATGSPQLLSYEGYLTDSSGNPLGGTGTSYCFRFSIYDNATVGAGTKLWPAGTAATTTATSTDGVFSALIGQADALTYNFYDNDSTYLNVDVYSVAASGGTCTGGSWQTLSPRQQIASAGYSISAENVYGSLLQTQTSNSRVQIGTGAGSPTPIYAGLDVKSTADYIGQSCTTSGTVWYNSAISKALVCENGSIQAISNSGATTTIAGLTANTGTAATTGTIVFSNSNGVSFGINGNTITASVNAGGGGTLSKYYWPTYQSLSSSGQTNASASIEYVYVPNNISFSRVDMPVSMSMATSAAANTAGIAASAVMVIYTKNASTLNPLVGASATSTFSWASNSGLYSSVTGARLFSFNIATSLTPGEYWVGMHVSTTSAISTGTATTALNATMSVMLASVNTAVHFANFNSTTNVSSNIVLAGLISSAITNTAQTLQLSQISMSGANLGRAQVPLVFRNY